MGSILICLIVINAFVVVYVGFKELRVDGSSSAIQFAAFSAFAIALLAVFELQLLLTNNITEVRMFARFYPALSLFILYLIMNNVISYAWPFKGTFLHNSQTAFRTFLTVPLIYVCYQLIVAGEQLSGIHIQISEVWHFSFRETTVTGQLFISMFLLGIAMLVFSFGKKLYSIRNAEGMTNQKIILLTIMVVPVLGGSYFFIFGSSNYVPYASSLIMGICSVVYGWTLTDFSLFRINSKVALKAILKSMTNVMIITDTNFKIVEINDAASRVLNISISNSEKSIVDLIKAFEPEGWKSIVKSLFEHPNASCSGEINFGKEEKTYFKVNISPVINAREQVTGYVMMGLNITEAKNREFKILEQSEKLEKSNVELERFAHIASHDLKTPLRNVMSFLDLIERRVAKYQDKDLKEFAYHARNGASHMFSLIQDILEFSKVQNEDIAESEKSEVDLNETMLNICMNLQSKIKEKDVQLLVSDLPKINAKQVHMTQLFGNLVENGMKYNTSKNPKIKVNHRVAEGRHIFAISDNGIGIEEKYYSRIFQMFKRLHTKSKHEGSGIGLSICKKIVDLYKGEIWLESKPGEGTTFFFAFSEN